MADAGKALSRGLDILEVLINAKESMAYGDIQKAVTIPPASFARLIKLLVERGYVLQAPDGRYNLGWGSLRLGAAGLARVPVRDVAHDHLKDITDTVQESTELALFEGDRFMFVDRIECPRSVSLYARPGSQFSINPGTAVGRIALSFSKENSDYDFTAEIRKNRFCGLVQNNDEAYRAASPVFDHTGRCIGALVVAAPAFRVGEKEKKEYKKILTDHAARISEKMGYTR